MRPYPEQHPSLRTIILLMSASLLLLSGCISPPDDKTAKIIRKSPLLPDVHAKVIELVADNSPPQFVFQGAPSSDALGRAERVVKGAVYGVNVGAVEGFRTAIPLAQAFAQNKGVFISLGLLAAGPVTGGTIGLPYGVIKEGIAENPAEADAKLQQWLADFDFENKVLEHLLSKGRQESRVNLIRHDEQYRQDSIAAMLSTDVLEVGFFTDSQWIDPDPLLRVSLVLQTKLAVWAAAGLVDTTLR